MTKLKASTILRKKETRAKMEQLISENSTIKSDYSHKRIKILELNQIKTLETLKEAMRACDHMTKNTLALAKLTNKQKAEIGLVRH